MCHQRVNDHVHPWYPRMESIKTNSIGGIPAYTMTPAWNPRVDTRFNSLDKLRGKDRPQRYDVHLWLRDGDELEGQGSAILTDSGRCSMESLKDWHEYHGPSRSGSPVKLVRAQTKSVGSLTDTYGRPRRWAQACNDPIRRELRNPDFGEPGAQCGDKGWLQIETLSQWMKAFGQPQGQGQALKSAVTRDRELDLPKDIRAHQATNRRAEIHKKRSVMRHGMSLFRAKDGHFTPRAEGGVPLAEAFGTPRKLKLAGSS